MQNWPHGDLANLIVFRGSAPVLNKFTCNACIAHRVISVKCCESAIKMHANPSRHLPMDILMVLLRVSTQRLARVDGRLAQLATNLFTLQGIGRFWHVSREHLAFLRSRLPARYEYRNLNCQHVTWRSRANNIKISPCSNYQNRARGTNKKNIEFPIDLTSTSCHAMFSLLSI